MLGSGTICDSVQTEHLDWTIAALALKYQNTKIPISWSQPNYCDYELNPQFVLISQ